jgi:16S rRNA A1518/A1519 N6-dimethyltransferase RsmA/KsgA/DIM1 with predicted DNA glycosylase/AP lyase activity
MLKSILRQNFTIDPNVLNDVLEELCLQPTDRLVEVGAGKGVLTQRVIANYRLLITNKEKIESAITNYERRITNKGNEEKIENNKDTELNIASNSLTPEPVNSSTQQPFLLSYEIDEDLREDLETIKRYNSDIFDFRLQNFLEAKRKLDFNKCTGNIPYHISEPLLFKLIEWDFEKSVFVTGIKFAKKVTGKIPGNLATISKYLFESKITKTYDKNVFFPRSKADSALLVMEKKVSFENEAEKKLNFIMKNVFKKHSWLNKYLGSEQKQIGQIYHMDLERLVEEVRSMVN